MIKLFFKLFLALITGIVNVFLLPVNALISNVFPDFTTLVANFTTGIQVFFTDTVSYFGNFLPPLTKELILLYLSILLIHYTLSIGVHAIMKVIHVIKALKIW